MKKKILLLITLVVIMFALCSCGSNETNNDPYGWHNRIDSDYKTSYQVLLNSGSCFVYTFRDEITGVWYISSSKGVTPRLNADGSLYTE